MKFEFKISKLANQFFFISNLSEWHFSCRKEYNQEWLKQTGHLNKKEEKVLEEFRKIIKKYGFTRDKIGKSKYLGQIFFIYPEKEVWNKLERFIRKDEFKKIKKVFEIFQSRFNKIWTTKSANILIAQVKYFKRYLNNPKNNKLFEDLKKIIGNGKSPRKFMVITLASPLKGEGITAAGGANIGDRYITLEIPELKNNSWEFEYSVGILAHEICHILFNSSRKFKILKKNINNLKLPNFLFKNTIPKSNTLEFITETIIESLVPYGYLSQKYFKNFNPMQISFSKGNLKIMGENFEKFKAGKSASVYRLRKFIIWQLYPFIINWIETKETIDEKFIKEIIQFILKIRACQK
ncbi:MAG: hypothetical protein AB1465_05970 [Patescibacteria group bacterium]